MADTVGTLDEVLGRYGLTRDIALPDKVMFRPSVAMSALGSFIASSGCPSSFVICANT